MTRTRVWIVIGIAAACALFAVVYVMRARREATEASVRPTGVVTDAPALRALLARPHAMFRTTRIGVGYGDIVVVDPADPAGTRYDSGLSCERVTAGRRGGVCLTAKRGVNTTYQAIIFDGDFKPAHRFPLGGIPSRVRMSDDGRFAGITVFVAGHAYSEGGFSTLTTIVDIGTGETLADVESFEVLRDGQAFKRTNFNFWGVTFTSDSNVFYATLGSSTETYLVKGDLASRRAIVVGDGVECPSLSPDKRRIAFKKRMNVNGRLIWRLAVLDLSTGDHRLIEGETRSVDDQVEWLDDNRIAYGLADETSGTGGTSIWSVDVSGGAAALWADGAYSPSMVR